MFIHSFLIIIWLFRKVNQIILSVVRDGLFHNGNVMNGVFKSLIFWYYYSIVLFSFNTSTVKKNGQNIEMVLFWIGQQMTIVALLDFYSISFLCPFYISVQQEFHLWLGHKSIHLTDNFLSVKAGNVSPISFLREK